MAQQNVRVMPCVVRGQWLQANGQPDTRSFIIQPMHGGWANGAWYGATEIIVRPAADGSWSATLLPSTVLGPYVVIRRGKRFRLVVPERPTGEFAAAATSME